MASQLMSSMAIVIIGGLTYATFMTLYIVPMMYDVFFKRMPHVVDIGSEEDLDDVPDDAAEYLAQQTALPGTANPLPADGPAPRTASKIDPSRNKKRTRRVKPHRYTM